MELNFFEGLLILFFLRIFKFVFDLSFVLWEVEFDVDVVLYLGCFLLVKLCKYEGVLDFDCFCSWVMLCRV